MEQQHIRAVIHAAHAFRAGANLRDNNTFLRFYKSLKKVRTGSNFRDNNTEVKEFCFALVQI